MQVQAWQDKVATDLYRRKGFRGEFCFDICGSHQLLSSSHLRERDKNVVEGHPLWWVLDGFLLGKAKHEDINCRLCNAPDNDGHLFWGCSLPPCVKPRNHPEIASLFTQGRTKWPRCMLWHGWLPGLTVRPDLPGPLRPVMWHVATWKSVCNNSSWTPLWDHEDAQDMAESVPDPWSTLSSSGY